MPIFETLDGDVRSLLRQTPLKQMTLGASFVDVLTGLTD